MDKKQIEQRLNDLVEWEKPKKVTDHANLKERNQMKRQLMDMGHDEDDIDAVLDEIEHDSRMIVDGVNITLPKKLKKVKTEPKLCTLGCGKVTVDQQVEITYHKYPSNHWRTKCGFCQYYQLPDGTFERNLYRVQAAFKPKNQS